MPQGKNPNHPGNGFGSGRVDETDASVGARAAQNAGVQHPRQLDVIGISASAGDETDVFASFDRSADIRLSHDLSVLL
jgi:hypothetical protein